MPKFTAPDGVRVEVITLSLTGNRDGQWFSVTDRYGHFLGETRTVAGLEALGVDVAALTEGAV